MIRPLYLLAALIPLSTWAVDELVRNPFWPQGYEGRRYSITTVPRYPTRNEPLAEELNEVKLKPGEILRTITNSLGIVTQVIESENPDPDEEPKIVKPKEKSAEQIENELWSAARKELRLQPGLSYEENGVSRHCFTINGLVYTDGDLISANCGSNRFTWRISGVSTNNILRVERMRRRELKESEFNHEQNNDK